MDMARERPAPHSVSVIICCYTEERLGDIREAAISVQRQTRPPDEIILAVDNNRALYDLLNAEFAGVARVILNESARGLSATRNAGIAVAQGDLVAFLDDDAAALPDWLDHLTDPFADTNVVAVGGRTDAHWIGGCPRWFPREIGWTIGEHAGWLPEESREVRNPHGGNMCLRKSVLLAAGGFDERKGRVGAGAESGEEAELCVRTRQLFPHSKALYTPHARIAHKVTRERATLRYLIRRSFQEGVAKGRLVQRYRGGQHRHLLSSEVVYLNQIVCPGISSRLRRFWQPDALAQLLTLLLCTIATAIGYMRGRLSTLPRGYTLPLSWELTMKSLAAKAGLSVQRLPTAAWEGDADFPRLLAEVSGLTMVDPNRLYILYQMAKRAKGLPGDAAEVGVYRGGTARLLGRVFNGGRILHLFDTFSGMPETDASKDTHKKGDFADTSLQGVRTALNGIPNLDFRPGFFPETAKGLEAAKFAFVHVDVDIHRSVADACAFFYPRLVSGGVMVFDDYAARGCPGVKPAVDAFFAKAGEPTLALPTTQCVVIKSR